jgi:hypothetical protein
MLKGLKPFFHFCVVICMCLPIIQHVKPNNSGTSIVDTHMGEDEESEKRVEEMKEMNITS